MIRCGIIGASGYTGGELIRLLDQHPRVRIVRLGARSHQGQSIANVHDHLYHLREMTFADMDVGRYKDLDVVFLALPHGHSSQVAKALVAAGVKVIDLGADFRLNDYAQYAECYESSHAWPEAISTTPYGLPECFKAAIQKADLIANPGCFPTAIILALAPLLKEGLIDVNMIVADAYTGITGAGKQPTASSHFPQLNDNMWPYKLGQHRHQPEIIGVLKNLCGQGPNLIFNPHLAPMDRGILATVTGRLTSPIGARELNALYQAYYQDAPFVRLRPQDAMPNVKAVRGSNYCDLCPVLIGDDTIVISSAIDNLVKGASGQAIQNMNLVFGFPETLGLTSPPLKP